MVNNVGGHDAADDLDDGDDNGLSGVGWHRVTEAHQGGHTPEVSESVFFAP